jgi:nucleoside-diphosphate-sugar epimerase
MRALVTGSSGHLGEALVRSLRQLNHEVSGVDLVESPFTTHVGSIADRVWVRRSMQGVQAVFHTDVTPSERTTSPRNRFISRDMRCNELLSVSVNIASMVWP